MNTFDRIGRSAAVVTSLILFALLVNLKVINASADESEPQLPKLAADRGGYVPEGFAERAIDSGSVRREDGVARLAEKLTFPFGARPLAFLLQNHLYVVDVRGKILGRADSLKVRDLPVVSGKNIQIDWQQRRITDDAALEALELLRCFEGQSELAPLISGVEVRDGKLIAFMNFGKTVPVIFGSGMLQEKVENLADYYVQLGADDLTRKARHLDLRVEDRIVVKKNG